MAKALLGTHMTPRTVMLVDEVRALRERVAQLEAQLAEAEAARREVEARTVLDLEQISEPEAVSA